MVVSKDSFKDLLISVFGSPCSLSSSLSSFQVECGSECGGPSISGVQLSLIVAVIISNALNSKLTDLNQRSLILQGLPFALQVSSDTVSLYLW